MGKMWDFFEHMDEMVYVSDMETYELVYMNKSSGNHWDITPMKATGGSPAIRSFRGQRAHVPSVRTASSNKEISYHGFIAIPF